MRSGWGANLSRPPLLLTRARPNGSDPPPHPLILAGVRLLLSRALALSRRLQLWTWASRGKSRMRWVGIRLDVELGEGVVFVRNPFLLAGVEPPGEPGSLTIRLGDRV